MNNKNSIDMLNGPLLSRLILFALPIAASSILQQLFNAADTAVVGKFASSQAMAAVGSNSSIINLIISLFVGLSVGANVVIARLIGIGRKEQISDAVHTAVLVSLISGGLILAIGVGTAPVLLRLMNTPEDVIDLASLYLRIYFLGMPFVMLYNFGSAILRSKGDSRRPLHALIAAGVINVALNLLLVIVFHLHVIGVGTATVLSNVVSAGIVLRVLLREEDGFQLEPKRLRIHPVHLRTMLQIGLPAGLQGMVFSLSNTVIQSQVNSFGAAASAGSAASLNFEIIAFYIVSAFNQTVMTFTSQNFGAGKYDRCKRVFRLCMLTSLCAAIVFDMTVRVFRIPLLGIFTSDPAVYAFAEQRILFVLTFQCLVNTYEISGSALRGMGVSLTPTIMMIFGTCVFRIFWALAVFPRFGSFSMLMYVYPASWILTGAIVLSSYYMIRRKLFRRGTAQG